MNPIYALGSYSEQQYYKKVRFGIAAEADFLLFYILKEVVVSQ